MSALALGADLRIPIEEALRRQLDQRMPDARRYGPEFSRLWELAAEKAVGGKLLRSRLLVEIHHALSDDAESDPLPATVLEIAALVEQIHFACLLHDDIIDGDVLRRGTTNLIGALSTEAHPRIDEEARLHWARSSALLMGDLLLASALLGAARADLASRVRDRLLDVIDRTVTETVAGEHRDVGLADGIIPPDLETILAMTADKTAAYSFELPLRCGAILAGASEDAEAALVDIGRPLGLAYQLQDDLLSVFGEEAEHGKDPRSDLREGKVTAIIAFARTTSTWPRIAPLFGSPDLQPGEEADVRDLLRACGAEAFVQRLVDEEIATARALLSTAERSGTLPPTAVDRVARLVDRVEGRRS